MFSGFRGVNILCLLYGVVEDLCSLIYASVCLFIPHMCTHMVILAQSAERLECGQSAEPVERNLPNLEGPRRPAAQW